MRFFFFPTMVFFSWKSVFSAFFHQNVFFFLMAVKFIQGGHGTGKTGNLAVNFSRQGKHREFSKFNFLYRENFENLEFFDNFFIKVATR